MMIFSFGGGGMIIQDNGDDAESNLQPLLLKNSDLQYPKL
jgi:hypothetical protein